MNGLTTFDVPTFLIHEEVGINESRGDNIEEGFVAGPNGRHYWVDDNVRGANAATLTESVYFNFPNTDFASKPWTAEVSYKANKSIQLCHNRGDNVTTSSTVVTISPDRVTVSYWGSFRWYFLVWPESSVDSDGFRHITVINTGKNLEIWSERTLLKTIPKGNRFDNEDIRWLPKNTVFKRFALTQDIVLPKELHHTANDHVIGVDRNLQLVDILTDKYPVTVFDENIVESVAQRGNHVFVKYSDGKIMAFLRPRGLDVGSSIDSIEIDETTNEVTIVGEDGKVFKVDRPEVINSESELVVPAGKGILSTSGVHKPLEAGEGTHFTKHRDNARNVFFNTEEVLPKSFRVLTSALKTIPPVDYSNSVTFTDISTDTEYRENRVNPLLEKRGEWQPIDGTVTSARPEQFDITKKVIMLPPGEYMVKGHVYRSKLKPRLFGMRLTGNGDAIYERVVSRRDFDESQKRSTGANYQIEARILVNELMEVRYEEFFQGYIADHAVDGSVPTVRTQIDFFKL